VAAIGVTIVAIFFAGTTHSVAGSFALITLTGIAALAFWMRGFLPRAGVAASVAVLGWAPFAFGGVAWELSLPLVASNIRCGTPDANLFMAGVMVLIIVCAVALSLSIVLARTRIADGFVRAGAYASVIAGVAIAALAVQRDGVEPEAWVEQLPILVDISKNHEAEVHGIRVSLDSTGCQVTFGDKVHFVRFPEPADVQPNCTALRVRHDPAHGRFVIQYVGTPNYPARAFDEALEPVDITARDVRDALKPPAGWVGSAVAGVGAAIGALVLATMLDRRARRFRSGALAQGTHTGEGWIEITGSGTKHVSEAQRLPIGPVVFEAREGKAATYRADGSMEISRVRRGTLADWLDRTLDVRASAFAFAVAAVALSCAPLIAARFVGLF
jgi:hypothetical protein